MFLRGHYQNAYVTRDLDRSLATLRKKYGIGEAIVFEPDMILKTPAGERKSSVKAALVWIGSLQLELIQPVSGFGDHYRERFPEAEDGIGFHHIAVRRDNLAEMRKEIAELNLPLLFEGNVEIEGSEIMVFVYLDARETLGHYLEYVWATPDGWTMQGWPAGRPID